MHALTKKYLKNKNEIFVCQWKRKRKKRRWSRMSESKQLEGLEILQGRGTFTLLPPSPGPAQVGYVCVYTFTIFRRRSLLLLSTRLV
jgi:hypothetical protein